MELAEVSYYFPPGKWTSSLFIYLFQQITLWWQELRSHQSEKLEIWTDDKSMYEFASLQVWRRHITWFEANTP